MTVNGDATPALRVVGGTAIVVEGGGGIAATNLDGVGLGVVDAGGSGSTIDLGTGTVVTATGFNATPGYIGATGIRSETGALVTARDLTVSSTSDATYGIYATDGGFITLTGLTTVTTASNGDEGSGLVASRPGSTLTAEDVVVTMDGVGSIYGRYQNPISAWRGAQLTVTGDATYEGIGQEIEGLAAFYAGSVLTLNNVTGSARGVVDYATGATATDGGIVTINGNADLAATGAARAFGLQAIGGGTISLLGSSSILDVDAPEAYGLYTDHGGTITLHNGTVAVTGSSAAAVYSIATDAVTLSTINVANSTMTTTGDGIVIRGGTTNLTFDNVTLSNDSGLSIDVGDNAGAPGTLNFTADASTLTGSAITASSGASNVTMQNASLWTVTSSSNLTSLTNDASTIQFAPPTGDPTQLARYKTLTVANYTGASGLLGLNTYLGADNSPSDRLVIDGGTASGTTGLLVTNSGGPGRQTTENGILLVESVNGGTTSAGAFFLAGPVAAGPYDYFLFKGGVSAGTGQNWYLRSFLAPVPPTPPLPPPGPDPIPLYRPEVATYSAVPGMELALGRAMIGTFHQRRGDQYLQGGLDSVTAAWGRFFGQGTDRRWSGTVSPEFDGHLFGLQAGLDLFSYEGTSGRGNLGLFVAHGEVDGDVRGFSDGVLRNPSGHLNLENTAFGVTWTHVGPTGWYLDGLVMGQHLAGTASSLRGVGVETDGTGFAVSLEGGYPFAIRPGLVVEPQAQFIWQRLDLDIDSDAFSAMHFDTTSLATGRLGLRVQGTFATEGAEWRPYLLANLWHDFGDTSTITFADTPIATKLGGTSLELGGGVVAHLNDKIGLFGQASYAWGLGGSDQRTIQGEVGLRVTW